MRGKSVLRSFILCVALLGVVALPVDRSHAWAQQEQPQQEQAQDQDKKDQQDQQQKKKKKGGFFGGLKAISGQSTEQTASTSTAGAKTVGEGEKMGSATPTDADRQQVTAMEKYSIPATDLKKFQQDGKLQPKQ